MNTEDQNENSGQLVH